MWPRDWPPYSQSNAQHHPLRSIIQKETSCLLQTETPGSTRIAAASPAGRKRLSGLKIGIAAGILAVLGAGVAVATTAANSAAPESANAAAVTRPATELKLGYFGNITHAPALVGVRRVSSRRSWAAPSSSTQVFNAGPAAIEALNAGAIDATYIGPNPAINSFVKSKGESISIIAGATYRRCPAGGQARGSRPRPTSRARPSPRPSSAAPRTWRCARGSASRVTRPLGGGGDVAINPTENAQTLKLFQNGKFDGAWLPEPWASRLVLQAGAKVLVDEKDLWDGSLTGKPGSSPPPS